MNCPDCSSDNIAGATECWSCGRSLVTKRDRPRSSPVVLAVFLVSGVAIVFMIVSSGGSGQGGAGPAPSSSATRTVAATRTAVPTASVPARATPVKGAKKVDSSP